jgi:hypothetical protein
MDQYIYIVVNPSMWWFDENGDYNHEGRGIPSLLSKVGRTVRPPGRDNDYLNEGVKTGMPTGYLCDTLMRVNDQWAAERAVHDTLKAEGRWCAPDTTGLGTEWFYAPPEHVRKIFESIRDRFEGVYLDPPRARAARLSPQKIQEICAKKEITTSADYAARADELMLPPAPWKSDPPYLFLNPSPQITLNEFITALRTNNITNVGAYDAWRPGSFPSRRNLEDGYFPKYKSLLEIIDEHMPSRSRR